MRREWSEAGPSRRVVFVLAALYWLGQVAIFVANLPRADSGYEAGRLFGIVFGPLLFALVARGAYVVFSRRRPRPPLWSWWVLVIGALLSLILVFQRAAADVAEEAG